MDPEIEEIIKKQMEKLPIEVKRLFTDPAINEKIINIGQRNGLNIEQLGVLQIETNLVMLGLVHPDEYRNELKGRLNIVDEKVDDIINELNKEILSEIREKLKEVYKTTNEISDDIWETEASTTAPVNKEIGENAQILKSAGIEIMPTNLSSIAELPAGKTTVPAITTPTNREEMIKNIEKPETITKTEVHPMFGQKMSKPFQIPMVQTEHSLENISKPSTSVPQAPRAYPPKADPYRLPPE